MLCWGRQLFIVIVIILGIGKMMAACGQKGPLYLPDDQAARPAAGKAAAKDKGKAEPAATPTAAPPEIPGPEPLPPPIR